MKTLVSIHQLVELLQVLFLSFRELVHGEQKYDQDGAAKNLPHESEEKEQEEAEEVEEPEVAEEDHDNLIHFVGEFVI